MGFDEFLESIADKSRVSPMTKDNAKRIRALEESINTPFDFKRGDLVTWKDGLKNKRSGGLMIITEVFDTPVITPNEDIGGPYYREVHHGKAGFIDPDGDLLEFVYDFRRLRKVEESELS